MDTQESKTSAPSCKADAQPLPQNPDALPKATEEFCSARIEVMIAGLTFRDHADAGNWLKNCIGVLTEYPEAVVLAVTDPRTGIQNSSRRLPGNADLRMACNASMDVLRKEYDASMLPQRLRDKAEADSLLEAERASHLTYAEMKAKYGVNGDWLPPFHDPVREAARKRSEDRNAAWNREYIAREYAMHGFRPYERNGVPITLSLALQMQALGKITLERA